MKVRTALVLLLAAGCDAEEPDLPPGPCDQETRGLEYAAGTEVTSQAGHFTATLVEAVPAPPIRDKNTWTLAVDFFDEPASAPLLIVEPYMPDHKHGSALTPVVSEVGDGTIEVSRIDLFMAGLWEVRVIAQWDDAGTAMTDRAVFSYCVE